MQQIDLEKLPNFAQTELQDFYLFLLQKYATESKRLEHQDSPLAPRLVKPFTPIPRDTLYER